MIPARVFNEPATRPITHKFNQMIISPAIMAPIHNQRPLPVVRVDPGMDKTAIKNTKFEAGFVPLDLIYTG